MATWVFSAQIDSDHAVQSLHQLQRTGLVGIDWRKGMIRRQPSMRDYADKLAKEELWPKMADDWRRIGLSVQTKYHRINPEYQKLVG